MLVLSRKQKQEILIGDNVKITVLKVKGNTVRLGIEAPRDVHVLRGELPQFDDRDESESRSKPAEEEAVAEFTVVFSNSDEPQSSKVDVIPFDAETRLNRQAKPENQPKVNDSKPDALGSIQFRDRLPKALQHNRLKEMVDQLTSKPSN